MQRQQQRRSVFTRSHGKKYLFMYSTNEAFYDFFYNRTITDKCLPPWRSHRLASNEGQKRHAWSRNDKSAYISISCFNGDAIILVQATASIAQSENMIFAHQFLPDWTNIMM